jgi:hypothetical protein
MTALVLGYRAAKQRRIEQIIRRHEDLSSYLHEMYVQSPPESYQVSQTIGIYGSQTPLVPRLVRLGLKTRVGPTWEEIIGEAGRFNGVETLTIQLNATEAAKSLSDNEILVRTLAFYSAGLASLNLSRHSRDQNAGGAWELWFNAERDIAVRVDVALVPDQFNRRYVSVRIQVIDWQKVGYW